MRERGGRFKALPNKLPQIKKQKKQKNNGKMVQRRQRQTTGRHPIQRKGL